MFAINYTSKSYKVNDRYFKFEENIAKLIFNFDFNFNFFFSFTLPFPLHLRLFLFPSLQNYELWEVIKKKFR